MTTTDVTEFRRRHGTPRPPFPTRPAPATAAGDGPGLRFSGLILAALVPLLTVVASVDIGAGALNLPAQSPSSPGTSLPTQAPAPQHPVATPATMPPPAAVEFPWLATHDDGGPVTWPCGPIHYRLVSAGAPAGARELLADALGRISLASGAEFREDTPRATSPEGDSYLGIEVSWEFRQDLAHAVDDPTVVGVGGASGSAGHFEHGYVHILRDWPGSSRADFGPESAGPVVLHELGHALGLSHTDDPDAIMYPSNGGHSGWTQSERAALRYLVQACE